MTGQLVSFECPTHGHLLDAPASSVVKCGRCKGDTAILAPEWVLATQKRRSQHRKNAVRPSLED